MDTVGLLAVWDRTDQWHAAATAVYARLLVGDEILITTSYVLAECGNAAARRSYRREVVALQRELEEDQRLIFPEAPQWLSACAEYAEDSPGGPGLVDQISFAVMRRYGLQQAFTNDRHFRAAGFTPLF